MKEIAKKSYVMLKESTLNSYSQIFFSSNKLFAGLLIVVTFFDLYAGISGLMAVIISNIAAYLIGFNRSYINAGYYGFNSLLVGLGLGIYYLPTPEYFMLLAFVSIFTLFISVVLEGVIGKYALPYLSIPFLIVLWLAILATREFSALTISERGIYSANEMYAIGGIGMVKIYEWFTNLNLHESIVIYFRSLAAIFFQYSLFSGIIIAIGILIYSRISFLLSLLGFFSAYLFYIVIGADINQLNYGYIGFNYILTAIAIGGFFIIPSKQSFLWVLLLTPLISIIIVSTSTILAFYQLSVYSLPFNFIVLVFLYVLKFRENPKLKPEVVAIQQNSPENNLYAHINHQSRFQDWKFVPISLPFWGNWKVSQGHNGEFTHKDKWKFAWDFQILGEDGETFKDEGKEVDDFLCYNKPVIAPADGWIEQIVNGISDNAIGDMNLEYNWGNSIVIKHSDKLYTQLSHLKNDSIKVVKGNYVKHGDVLASCGNSGRSPEPHLHFQVQSTP
ncbi:MAG: urea transporter, partial [Bacteroidetes bacterium]|nr:urea transporter [Bacteroidota bacterium]